MIGVVIVILVLGLCSTRCNGASFIVAAHNSLPSAKARADIICNGTDDQIALIASMKTGTWLQTEYDDNAYTMAWSGQSVEWLAGDYYLSGTVFIPQCVDTVLEAEGTILHYLPTTGDAVVVTGSLRSRFNFGTIWTGSTGAALAAKDRPYSNPFMPNLMSIYRFQGLQHTPPYAVNGFGFFANKHFCVNSIEGTDIRGFGTGIMIDDSDGGTEGKIDTNWWWLSYVRACGTDIKVTGNSVDSQQWYVNVDATTPNSIAIRTAAKFERWYIIMGTWDRSPGTRSIILDPGAESNWMEIQPQLWTVDGYENHSGYSNNVFVQIPKNTAQTNGTLQDQTHLVLNYSPFDDGPGSQDKTEDLSDSIENIKQARVLLQELKSLWIDQLITEEEYNHKRKQILSQI
jgi:hypothetical protein